MVRGDYLNGGRLKSSYYRSLKHLKHGSWGFFGEDVITGEESQFCTIKPDRPRTSASYSKGGERKEKTIKYESPRKSKARKDSNDVSGLFAVKPTLKQWLRVAERHNVPMPEEVKLSDGWARGFYEWVRQNPSIPIDITEGAKKASVPITDGYVSVGANGVWQLCQEQKDENGYKTGKHELIPALESLAQEGREFRIAFDNDKKESTRQYVSKAIIRAGNLLSDKGCSVSVVTWDEEEEKGLDDLIVAHGFERFSQALKERVPFDEYKLQRYLASQKKAYEKNKKFTPQRTINQQYLDVDFSANNSLIFAKSFLGSGKTHRLIKMLEANQQQGCIYANYRNTLCLQFNERAKEIGFYHFQSEKNLEEFSLTRPDLKVSFCVDSLINFEPSQFDGKIIILDEIVSVLKHLLFSSTIRQFTKVRELFTEMIRRSDRVIALDANLQDWCVDFLSALCSEKQVVTIENTFIPQKSDVILLDGVIKDEVVQKNNRSPHIQSAITSDRPILCSDSQILCESMEQIYHSQGRRGMRIDSKTTSRPEVKAFLENPVAWIKENQPDYVIYSPSAESGLDINIKGYFSGLFGFFFGALDIASILQMLGRLRDPSIQSYVWCKQHVYTSDNEARPSNLTAVKAQRHNIVVEEIGELIKEGYIDSKDILSRLVKIHDRENDPFINTADKIQAIRNHEFKNYRLCLADALIKAGHNVEFYRPNHNDDFTSFGKLEKEAKEEVKESDSGEVFDSSDKYIGGSTQPLSYDASEEDKNALRKAKIVAQLPKINQDEIWSPGFIYNILYKNPQLIKQVENNYLLHNPDTARLIALSRHNRIHNNDGTPTWKIRAELPRLSAIRDTGILAMIEARLANPDLPILLESEEVQSIISKCQTPRRKRIMGNVGKYPIKFISRQIKLYGYEFKSSKVRKGETTKRVYRLDIAKLADPSRLAIKKAIELKYAEKINLLTEPLKWEKVEVKTTEKVENRGVAFQTAQSIGNKGINPVADEGVFSNKPSAICHTFSKPDKAVNFDLKSDTTEVICNPLDTEESICDLAGILEGIESAEELAELSRQGKAFSRSRLNRAVRRLSTAIQQRIRRWAIGNRERRTI